MSNTSLEYMVVVFDVARVCFEHATEEEFRLSHDSILGDEAMQYTEQLSRPCMRKWNWIDMGVI